ncbi:hypothetical protein [Vibrio nitrifigilis]|uniref:Uncharacterized protein n=1 Tax=Vibrio nitrifigilis TaxID=2789781 RepID=A0ABS0GLJ8_9VIBR|nr:hypothetical protein [Vibrio nitrifigilis]MBF9003326.1 hypothetical protein [Vibrio nitrifigilis]
MKVKIYEKNNIKIFTVGNSYYIQYDAGAHQIAIREDEISEGEANIIINDESKLMEVLFAIQKRLIARGEKPYKSNV